MRDKVAWAAGLFEGEGCWRGYARKDVGHGALRAGAVIRMTDEDVIRRFHDAVGFGSVFSINPPSRRNPRWRPVWVWETASFEKAQALGAMFWPWLGERRRARFVEVMKRAAAAGIMRRRVSSRRG